MVALNLVNRPNKRRQTPEQVSELTTNRLSVYLRCLNELDAAGVQTISSQALAEQFHLNAAQIRKDLAYFGEFGVRGVGYYVKEPGVISVRFWDSTDACEWASWAPETSGWRSPTTPGSVRKASRSLRCSISRTRKSGMNRAAPIHDIRDLKRLARRERFDIAVIAVPAHHAQPVVDQVVDAGIKAILNWRPEGPGRSEAEERGSHRVAGESVVLSRAGRRTERTVNGAMVRGATAVRGAKVRGAKVRRPARRSRIARNSSHGTVACRSPRACDDGGRR